MKRFALCTLRALAALFASSALLAQTPRDPASDVLPRSPIRVPGTIAPQGTFELRPGMPLDDTSGIAPAASATFEPSTTRVGRPVEFRVAITGGQRVVDLPSLPEVDGLQFDTLRSPSYSLQSFNGQMVGTSILRFTAFPRRAGEFTVPSFAVDVGGKRVQVPSAKLIVTELQPGEVAYQPLRSLIEVPQREFFVGETIKARLIFAETPDEQPQSVQHFAKSSGGVLFKPNMRNRREQVTVDGRTANALTMNVEITPLVAGETEVNCQVIVLVAKNDPFGRRGALSQSTIDVPSVRFKVLPVPVSRPPGFTGAIGEFTMASPRLSATEIEVGEPLTMTVALTGQGNLDGVPAPELEPSAEWTAYRPTSEFQRDDESGLGTKLFTYTLVPKRDGRKGTPALPFAYFNPAKREFVDITIPPQPVNVKASAAAPTATDSSVSASGSPESSGPTEPPREVEPTLTGLADTAGTWRPTLGPNFATFYWLQAIPPLILLGLWAYRRRTDYLAAHPEIERRRRARRSALSALARARHAVRRGDQAGFVDASLGALRAAAAPLDSTQPESLTREEIVRQLGGDQRAARTTHAIFDRADATRYASTKTDLNSAAELLPEVEHAVAALHSRQ